MRVWNKLIYRHTQTFQIANGDSAPAFLIGIAECDM